MRTFAMATWCARATAPRLVLTAAAVLAVCGTAGSVSAHEFWLDAIDYRPKARDSVPIVIRNGQNFLGNSYPYIRKSVRRFTILDARGERAIKAVEGDDPAAEITLANPGLAIVAYQSAPETVTFETMERFVDNLKEEGLEAIVDEHDRQGKPRTGIKENFARSAKALIDVGGTGGGNDRAIGLPIEIVAESNPYRLPAGAPMIVRVLHRGQPLRGVLLKVFHLKDPESPRRVRTGDDGRASLLLPLPGEYLLNAVHMLPAEPKEQVHWSSIWASLTFKRP